MLKQIKGNARTCVWAEPLFVIPGSMYTTYASVYMLKLHVTDFQLGIVTTLNLILQMLSAFVSGYLTDRMGRRKALWVFDVVSWSLGTFIWAISQNFWWFVLAAFLNSFQRIPATAWYCLLVEDTSPDKRTFVFTGLQIVSVVGGLFAPIGGILVAHYSLVPATRIIYAFSCVSMSLMIYLRHKGLHETEIGLRKIQEREQAHFLRDIRQYGAVIREIFKNRALVIFFSIYVLWNVQMTINTTFLSVYQVNYLHLPAAFISIFPAISSVAMVVLLFTVVPKFQDDHAHRWMMVGFIILLLSNAILIATPKHNFTWVIVSTVLTAVGTIIANPYVESVVANAIDDEQRATMLSVLNVLILAFTSPAGIIGGWTYGIDPRIPIAIIAGVFTLSCALIWYVGRIRRAPDESVIL